jgi:hypothetical protein
MLLTVFEYFENHWIDFPRPIQAFFSNGIVQFVFFLSLLISHTGVFILFNLLILNVGERFNKFLTEKKYRFDVWIIFSFFIYIMFLAPDYEYKLIKDFINP